MKYLRAHNMGALLIGLCLLINLIPFVSNTDEYENLALGKAHTFAFSTDDKVKIIANVNYPNNDGMHINCSRNVTISN